MPGARQAQEGNQIVHVSSSLVESNVFVRKVSQHMLHTASLIPYVRTSIVATAHSSEMEPASLPQPTVP